MKKKIGVLSCSISIILMGVLLLLNNFKIQIPYIYYNMIGPLFLILLGVEIILGKVIYGEENNRINIGLIIFTIIIMIISLFFFSYMPINIDNIFKSGSFSISNIISGNYLKYEKHIGKSIDLNDNVTNVNITNKMGTIKFSNSLDNTMRVNAVVHYSNRNNDINLDPIILTIEGNTVYLKDNIKNDSIIIDYTIEIPQNKILSIDNRFGFIKSDKYIGKTDISNKFGNIELNNLDGDSKVTNKYGNIEIKDIKDGSLYAENEFGNINVNGIPSDINVELNTNFGSISTGLPLNVNKFTTESTAKGILGSGKYNIKIVNDYGTIELN
ncbi:MAG: hypothetical protein QME35_01925 [Thermoanaerobacteraceae bacterium]|nr:hypothetical protein [Thermoanaerobacteraceae bacterium]